ncbi:MAG: hypothetical protein JXR77_12410, partial [Lentisphaeria bacterium]|nr:hypothetical protein [Lentisphaeria bacterium]
MVRILAILTLTTALTGFLRGAPLRVPNPSFENGNGGPEFWTAAAASSAWERGAAAEGDRFVSVLGNGSDNTYWRSAALDLTPGGLYRLVFQARGMGTSGGTAVTGPVFCNWDIGCPGDSWERYATVFSVPDTLTAGESWLRFGQWHVDGRVAFDDIALAEVQPVYGRVGDLELGEGEAVEGSAYSFEAGLGGVGRNHSRPLWRNACGFNSNRWVFGADSEVVHRHRVGAREQTRGRVEVTVGWYSGGLLSVEACGADGAWLPVGTLDGVGTVAVDLPKVLFPCREVSIRLRATAKAKVGAADSDPGSFQVHGYRYQANLSGPAVTGLGTTRYVEVAGPGQGFEARVLGLGEGLPGGRNTVEVALRGAAATAGTHRLAVTLQQERGEALRFEGDPVVLGAGETVLSCPYEVGHTGRWTLTLALGAPVHWQARAELLIPAYYETGYGFRLPGSSAEVGLWTAGSGWKIPRTRSLPDAPATALLIRAAANEAEAVQLVLRPVKPLRDLTLTPGPLRAADGSVIPAAALDVLRVRYVPVSRPTDATGVVADWPDPLPPVAAPLDLEGGVNQPFWLRLRVPSGTPGGVYEGTLRLSAEGYGAEVPLRAEVYSFELPARMACETAFGFSPGEVWRYQNVHDPDQRRLVLERYWRNFAEHHISPYDPAPLDPFRVTWPALGSWLGGTRDAEVKAAGESSLRLQDQDGRANVSARYADGLAIPPGGFLLRFRYRTAEAGHPFIVTFNHFDRGDQWMSGRNNDMLVTGDGSWQLFERRITSFPAGAAAVRLTLWATEYADDGHFTGTVWYDDLTCTAAATGQALVTGGDFEPLDPGALVPRIDWQAWDRAMTRAMDEFHFNTFRLPVMGLGGGTFHARSEPSLLGYDGTTPTYRAAMGAYLGAVEAHLRTRGWLDEAYVYWFDEPDPKDYTFVMNGFRTLREGAPGLRRMLTEQVEEALLGGPNLWCPVSPQFDPERAAARRVQGEQFWWYVCTGPKAPYCTLFIDHPGTEMRVWLWQTWARGIEG